MRKTVAEVMSVDFVTVTARMLLEEALVLLVDSESSELCVVDDRGRFEGIVTDFDLLKAQLSGDLARRNVGSSISRAITVLTADTSLEQAIPLFREGSCSRAYVCRDGRLLGRLARLNVLKHLAEANDGVETSPSVRPAHFLQSPPHPATVQRRETSPRAPQFLAVTSVLGSVSVERSQITSRPSA